MTDFKLDRTSLRAQTKAEAADHRAFYQRKDWKERMEVAAYLISVAYKYDPANPPAMNRRIFSVKSLSS